VSLFVLSPEIKNRDEVEVATGRSTERPSNLSDIHIRVLFFLQADQKKIGHEIPEIQLIVHYIIFFAIAQILCYHQVTFLRQ
jgi:hypothetical protein